MTDRPKLSPRQRSVAHLIAQAYTDKQIAGELGIAPKTVKHMVGTIADKLALDRNRNLRVQIANKLRAA